MLHHLIQLLVPVVWIGKISDSKAVAANVRISVFARKTNPGISNVCVNVTLNAGLNLYSLTLQSYSTDFYLEANVVKQIN